MKLQHDTQPRTENDMTTDKKIARRKLSLLELAAELGNVSKACRVMGYSRQQFYQIRRNFQTYGAEGLLDQVAGARPPHPGWPRTSSRRSSITAWPIPVMAPCGSPMSWRLPASR
jgi:hypothetical protein